MKYIISKVLVFVLLFFACSAYAEVSVSLTVDKTTASVDDTIVVQVDVKGKTFADRPQLNGISDFNVRFAGTSSQVQIINGNISSAKVFQYVLYPKTKGQFTIGPAVVEEGGNEYRSDTVTISIVGEQAQVPREKYAYLSAKVSNENPYVGEQILYTLRFYTKILVQNGQISAPDFKGFWKEQLGNVRSYEQVMNGEPWEVNELKTVLFPAEAGEQTIDGASLVGDVVVQPSSRSSIFDSHFFGMFQDTERKVFRSNPIKLNVKTLPEEGKPADFTGLVGSFSVKTEIGSTELEVGDSATLTLTVSGDGDLRNLPAPKLSDAGNFKTYDDQPSIDVKQSAGGIRETKVFKKAIVPLRPGKLVLPAFNFNYFDTKKAEYVSMSTDPITLNVSPSSRPEKVIVSSGEGNGVLKQELKVLGEDLTPVVKSVSALEADVVKDKHRLFFVLLAILPFVAFVVALLWHRRIQKMRTDSGFVRRGKAFRRATKGITKLTKVAKRDFYSNASFVLRDYISDRCNIDGRSMTVVDVERRLEPFGVNREVCRCAAEFLNDCDAGLYGGMALSEERRNSMLGELKDLIKTLEREMKK